MKIAMLVPFSDKGTILDVGALKQAKQLGDAVIVLKDNAVIVPPGAQYADEIITVRN